MFNRTSKECEKDDAYVFSLYVPVLPEIWVAAVCASSTAYYVDEFLFRTARLTSLSGGQRANRESHMIRYMSDGLILRREGIVISFVNIQSTHVDVVWSLSGSDRK